MLRIALFGQAPLAADCLDRLVAEEHELAAVYAPPDGARPDPLAARAREHGLHVIQRRFFVGRIGGQPWGVVEWHVHELQRSTETGAVRVGAPAYGDDHVELNGAKLLDRRRPLC